MSDKCSTCSMNGSCDTGECQTRLPPGILSEYDLSTPVADGIAVWLELSGDRIRTTSLEAVSKAREMNTGRVFGIVFGDGGKRSVYSEAFEHGIDSLYHVRSPELNTFDPDAYGNSIKKLMNSIFPAVLFIPMTDDGLLLSETLSNRYGMTVVPFGHDQNGGSYPKIMLIRKGEFKAVFEKGRKGTVFNIMP